MVAVANPHNAISLVRATYAICEAKKAGVELLHMVPVPETVPLGDAEKYAWEGKEAIVEAMPESERYVAPEIDVPTDPDALVPADAILCNGDTIQVDQSALTGESLPVTHESGDVVYSGSVIRRGEIDALVYGTGKNTYFGKTAHLVETAHTTSHFQRAVLKIGDYLIVLAVTLVILILGVALFRGDDMLTTLQFALILTVAAIPVAMPTVLSVTMAVGARLLAKKQAIVSHLAKGLASLPLQGQTQAGCQAFRRL